MCAGATIPFGSGYQRSGQSAELARRREPCCALAGVLQAFEMVIKTVLRPKMSAESSKKLGYQEICLNIAQG
jgi:hypothetical protein